MLQADQAGASCLEIFFNIFQPFEAVYLLQLQLKPEQYMIYDIL